MTAARKIKVSVSLDAELLGVVNRAAAREGTTRSALLERWLRESQRRANVARLEEETATYYDSLTVAETEDDARWASASARGARHLSVDGGPSAPSMSRPGRAPRRRKA